MINVQENFKIDLKTYGRQFNIKLKVNNSDFNADNLNYIKPSFTTPLFKTIMHQIELDSKVFMSKGTKISGRIGVKVNEKNYKYIDLNNYYVQSCERQEDTNSYRVLAYSKMKEAMVDYDLSFEGKTTVRNYLIKICERLGWNTDNIPATFINSGKMIDPNLHTGINYSFRDTLDEIATITCSFLMFKGDNFYLLYLTETNETIDESYLDEDNVTIGEKYFINSLVFSRAEESDNIYRKDNTSITANGLHEYRIADCQLLSTNDRADYIDEMFNYLKTLEFYIFDVQSKGILFLEACDLFNFKLNNTTYKVALLNDEINIDDGLAENLFLDEPEETKTEYKYADSTDKKINQAYILVDKQNKKIIQKVSSVEQSVENITNTQNTATGKNIHLEDSSDEPLVSIKVKGSTSQATRSGKNLLNVTAKTTTAQGLTFTINEDKSITINGTNTGTGTYYFRIANNFVLPAGNYTLNNKNPDVNNNSGFIFYDDGNNFPRTNISNATFTEDTTIKPYLKVNAGVTVNNQTVYPMIMKGTYTEETIPAYEQYGASPSPDYPSPIENIEGNIEIKNVGKNLFDISKVQNVKEDVANCTVIEKNANGVKIQGATSTATDIFAWSKGWYCPGYSGADKEAQASVKEPCTIKLSADVTLLETVTEPRIRMSLRKVNGDLFLVDSTVLNLNKKTRIETTLKVNPGNFSPFFALCSNTFLIENIMISTTGGEYKPYQEQKVDFPLSEGQKLYEGSYLASDGIHHKRKQTAVNISAIVTLSNGNIGGTFQPTGKKYSSNNELFCTKAKHDTTRSFITDTVYENQGNVVFVGDSTDTLETLKEKYDGAILEYLLAEEEIVPYTEEQQEAWNKIEQLHTYKNVTNIFSDAELDIVYVRDNGLSDMYETKQNAERNYTKTTEKLAEQKITTDEISSKVSSLETTTVKEIQVQYALGDTSTTPPTAGWSETAPEWQAGKYMWQKTVTVYANGTTVESSATCIQGAKGEDGGKGDTGATGKGIKSIQEQYYLSTSNTTQTGGNWKNTQDIWTAGKYIWTRSHITWSDNTTTDTTPILAQGLNTANKTANDTKENLENNYSTTVEMNSAITTKADEITTEVNKKVNEVELGTKIEQNYEHVKVAWNKITEFIQMMILNGNASLAILDNSKKILMSLDKTGQHFYDSSENKIGDVGVINYKDTPMIAFNLNVSQNNNKRNGLGNRKKWNILSYFLYGRNIL